MDLPERPWHRMSIWESDQIDLGMVRVTGVVELEVVESSLRAVQYPESIMSWLDLEARIDGAVNHDNTPSSLVF